MEAMDRKAGLDSAGTICRCEGQCKAMLCTTTNPLLWSGGTRARHASAVTLALLVAGQHRLLQEVLQHRL